jgi:LPS O-antigen subunit length determinant protein (WzzB/FepE family)
MKKRIESDEIDLIEVVVNIWNNKLKIAAITAIFIIISAGLYFAIKPPLNAKTEILPITIFENNLYSPYNSLLAPQAQSDDEKIMQQQKLNNINQGYLLSLFLEALKTRKIIIEAIKKYQLIDQSKFNDENEYLEAVEKYALSLDLLRPINVDGSKRGETRLNWIIEFKINDKDKYEMALSYIESEINKNIQKYLRTNFDITLSNLKLLDQFKLEDLELKIKNVKNDYDTETINRLAFLREQALIARKLNIVNNTLEVENFSTPSGVISNVQTATPYYMRGYSMIEKEIELIETRTNKDAFTKNLLDLEKQKRDLLTGKSLERIEELFNSTPIVNGNNFKAANIIYKDTKYEASFSLIKAVLFAGIFGVIFGMFYVLISNAIQQRK